MFLEAVSDAVVVTPDSLASFGRDSLRDTKTSVDRFICPMLTNFYLFSSLIGNAGISGSFQPKMLPYFCIMHAAACGVPCCLLELFQFICQKSSLSCTLSLRYPGLGL